MIDADHHSILHGSYADWQVEEFVTMNGEFNTEEVNKRVEWYRRGTPTSYVARHTIVQPHNDPQHLDILCLHGDYGITSWYSESSSESIDERDRCEPDVHSL